MKIAMFHWGYPPVIGGVETHLVQMCPALEKLGHHVWLLTGSHPAARSAYVEKGVRIRRSPNWDLNWLQQRGFANLTGQVRKEISEILDASRADVIHAHNMHYFSQLHARVLESEARKRNIPIVLSAHNIWDDAECITLCRDIKWDHVIAVSNYIRMELEGYGIEPKRITAVHHGIDGKPFFEAKPDEAYRKYPQLKGRRVVFHAARSGLAKGTAISAKALRIIKQEVPEVMLVMAGSTNIIDWGTYQQKELAYIFQIIDMFDLTENTLIDSFPLKMMPAMYAAADVVVYPSIFQEPFGIVMLEALASAKPIIVSRSGGMPEIIKNNINGYVVTPHDHRELAKRIIHLLKHPEVAREIGARGRESFKQKYYLERMVHQIVSVYTKAIEDYQV